MFLSDDDMVECPYNKTHRMLRKRLQSHLLKCRLNYPDVELRKCPFNITHLVPEPEFTHHATNCPDRKLITQYKYDAPVTKKEEEDGPSHAPIECDEDWDDTDVNDYNPQLYLEMANVIRKPDGANPSERKLFIKKERKRLGDGDDSSEDETSTTQNITNRSPSPTGCKRKRHEGNNEDEPHSSRSYETESGSQRNSKQRSRSPINKYKRDRSRSPAGYRRSYRASSPPCRRNSPPSTSMGIASNSYDQDKDPYYSRWGESNNSSFSSRDPYYSNGNHSQAYYDRSTETNSTMPDAPPPPMISYPARRSYLTTKQQPPADY